MDSQLPVPAPQDFNEQARKNAAVVAKIVDTVAFLPKIDLAPFAWVGRSHLSTFTAIADAIGPTLKAIDMIKPVYLDAIEEFTSPRWMKLAQEMMDSQNRALQSVMKMMEGYSFMPILWDEPETPMYVPPPRHTETHIHETHLTIHIQTLVIGAEGEEVDAPTSLPDAGCLLLDTFIALKHEGDEQGLWYWKRGQWHFANLPPLAMNVLLYLYQMRLYPERYAQRVKDIADAMKKRQESISRELSRVKKLCRDLEIKPILEQTSGRRWCVSPQLSCSKNIRS